jgi:phosphoglycolate phosphatase-like HAD superfamily hydrolase
MPFAELAGSIAEHGGGLQGLKAVVGENLTAEFEARLTRLAQEAYGGTTACRRLYGFEPVTIRQPGRWRTEVPLLSPEIARAVVSRAGIVTGRSAAEMALAFELLGWRLPDEQVAVSNDPAFDKPNPAKLTAILNRMQSRKALFVGDTRDDLELVMNAQQSDGGELDFGYVGPIPCPWPEVAIMAPDVTELLKTIEVTHDEA